MSTTSLLFPGYNLRGLIVAYLEEHGWAWRDEGEWTRGDVVYRGDYATQEAMHHQIETEEGRWDALPGKERL